MQHDAPERVWQQHVEAKLGIEANVACAPTAFYIEARRQGYPSGTQAPEVFVGALDFDHDRGDRGWLRPTLSSDLRSTHGLEIVSWNTANELNDIDQMRNTGYLHTDREVQYFLDKVQGHSVLELVESGNHVISAMAPGFGANRSIHTVILSLPEPPIPGQIAVTDPDRRNAETTYSSEYIEHTLQAGGACSIVLPHQPA